MEKFTENQMREFGKAVAPAIEAIQIAKKRFGITGIITFNISDDWMDAYGLGDWNLTKNYDGKERCMNEMSREQILYLCGQPLKKAEWEIEWRN